MEFFIILHCSSFGMVVIFLNSNRILWSYAGRCDLSSVVWILMVFYESSADGSLSARRKSNCIFHLGRFLFFILKGRFSVSFQPNFCLFFGNL